MSFELIFFRKISLTLSTFVWFPLVMEGVKMSLYIKGMVKRQPTFHPIAM